MSKKKRRISRKNRGEFLTKHTFIHKRISSQSNISEKKEPSPSGEIDTPRKLSPAYSSIGRDLRVFLILGSAIVAIVVSIYIASQYTNIKIPFL